MKDVETTEIFTPDDPAFWGTRYQEKRTPWDLGKASPPFIELLSEQNEALKPGKMAVLGSGYGHDAALFGQLGFEVTGFDFVPEAVKAATDRYGQHARFVQANIFELDAQFQGHFDFVLEHTCYCAIPPSQRTDYVRVAAELLKPGGRFIGLFWVHQEKGGPPYSTTIKEIIALFSPLFAIDSLSPTPHSVWERKGEELLGVFSRKS
jgi:methyl halide transferase